MDVSPRVLENHIVRLEPLKEAHREEIRPLADDMSMWPQTTMRADGEHFDIWFDKMLDETNAGRQISHLVRDAATQKAIGHSAYLTLAPEHRRLEIGWTWYVADKRGGKTNPACKFLLLNNAFEMGAERVELRTALINKRSQAAMKKMGAKQEGILRHHILTWSGDWRDTVYFSILRSEWPEVKKGLEARL